MVISKYLGGSVPQSAALCVILNGFPSQRDSIGRRERLLDEGLELAQRVRCKR